MSRRSSWVFSGELWSLNGFVLRQMPLAQFAVPGTAPANYGQEKWLNVGNAQFRFAMEDAQGDLWMRNFDTDELYRFPKGALMAPEVGWDPDRTLRLDAGTAAWGMTSMHPCCVGR